MEKRKTILKDAVVLLIAAILILTTIIIIPMTTAQKSDHDAGVTTILSPTTGPPQTYPVEVTVKNYGTNTETSVPVEVTIEEFITDPNNGTVIYDATSYIPNINPGEFMNVAFPSVYLSEPGKYQATACTQLVGDENPSNDCLTVVFYIAINIFGFNHIPLGDATLAVVDGTLVVSNIGTSGNDGVQILLPENIVNFRPEIEFPADQDMSLALTSKGIVDGEPGQVATVTSFDLTNGGKNIVMTFDPSALQPQYIMAHYYLNGSPMPIKSEKIPMNGKANPTWEIALAAGTEDIVVRVEAIPRQMVAIHTDVDTLGTGGPYSQSLSNLEDNGICSGVILTGDPGNTSTPNGNETTTDEIWLYTQNCSFQLQNYTDITLKGTAIDPTPISLTIANEKAVSTQTKLPSPEMTGPANGKVLRYYDYNVSGIDPQGSQIFYWIFWGDDTSAGWLGPYNSGSQITEKYWWLKGDYIIGALVKNTDGFYSSWGVLHLTIPKGIVPNQWFLHFLLNHPHAFPILRHIMGY
jgi:hypothetical protein